MQGDRETGDRDTERRVTLTQGGGRCGEGQCCGAGDALFFTGAGAMEKGRLQL